MRIKYPGSFFQNQCGCIEVLDSSSAGAVDGLLFDVIRNG